MLIVSKTYFIIAQILVIVLFYLLKQKDSEVKKEIHLFSSPLHFTIFIPAAISIGYFLNKDVQLFCNPVNWVNWILIPYSIFLIGNRWFKKWVGEKFNLLILGIGIFISSYIILFGSTDYLIFVAIELVVIIPIFIGGRFLNKKFDTTFFDALNLLGITVLLPFIIIYWSLKQMKTNSLQEKILLGIFPILIFCIGLFFTFRMNRIINTVNASSIKVKTLDEIIQNRTDKYLTELILGAHWKYHTEICLFDGWRPPFHDPVLGFANIFLYPSNGFNIELHNRQYFYKDIFPNKKTSFECRCAINQTIY